MEEVIKHTIGVCGENHPHLFNLSAFLVGIVGYISYIKLKIRSLWNNNKN
jgi:hypothetical protein